MYNITSAYTTSTADTVLYDAIVLYADDTGVGISVFTMPPGPAREVLPIRSRSTSRAA